MATCLIIQLPMADLWGTDAEIALRDELVKALQEGIKAHGIGRFRGIEDWAGKSSIILTLPKWDYGELPLEFVLSELRLRELLEHATVAYMTTQRRSGIDDVQFTVVWPKGYQEIFSLE